MAKIYHFSGAGNDFVVLDGRREDLSAYREPATIRRLCDEYGTDGLMILSLCDNDVKAKGPTGEETGRDGYVKAKESIGAGVGSGSNDIGRDAPAGSAAVDFTMEFYNPDGTSGMMCGNGGRCIAAFADYLGISAAGASASAVAAEGSAAADELPAKPDASADGTASVVAEASADGAASVVAEASADGAASVVPEASADGTAPSEGAVPAGSKAPGRSAAPSLKRYLFRAPDGVHTAEILERDAESQPGRKQGGKWLVRLGMRDVEGVQSVRSVEGTQSVDSVQGVPGVLDGYFLNTGTRHFVKFVPDVEAIDIDAEALPIRHNPIFAPEGTNVNFVQIIPGGIKVRTFEKGVEGETLACGTGITASAIAAVFSGRLAGSSIKVQARRDALQVDFATEGVRFTHVFLTGPAELL